MVSEKSTSYVKFPARHVCLDLGGRPALAAAGDPKGKNIARQGSKLRLCHSLAPKPPTLKVGDVDGSDPSPPHQTAEEGVRMNVPPKNSRPPPRDAT